MGFADQPPIIWDVVHKLWTLKGKLSQNPTIWPLKGKLSQIPVIQVLACLKIYILGGTAVPLYRAGAGYLLRFCIFRDIFHNVLRNAWETGPDGKGSVRTEVPLGVRASWWECGGLDVGSKPGQWGSSCTIGVGWPRQGHSQGSARIQGADGEFRSVRFGRCDDHR